MLALAAYRPRVSVDRTAIVGPCSGTTITFSEIGNCYSYGTMMVCPCCGQSASNHYVSWAETITVESEPALPRLDWRSRTIGRWRPYCRPVAYAEFIRPRIQRRKPKCRDPPRRA